MAWTDLDETFKKNLYDTYSITPDIIDNIHTQAKNKSTDKSLIKGYWVVSDDGELNKNLSKPEQIYLELQIERLIRLKYNFIHYNPFPKVKNTSFEEFLFNKDDDNTFDEINQTEDIKTNNQKILHFIEKLL